MQRDATAAGIKKDEIGAGKRLNLLRTIWRCLQLAGLFGYGATTLLLQRPKTRMARAKWLHVFCALAMKRLGIEVTVRGAFPDHGALISNHLSYVDIVLYASLRPCVFVAKAEIKSWPVVGWMTTMAGTVYVERGHGGSAKRAGARVSEILSEGIPLVLFPEGTTSRGEGVLPFHSGLLGQLAGEGQRITGAFLRYSMSPQNPGSSVRDDVHFWGDAPMVAHIIRFLGLRGVRADVIFAEAPMRFRTEPPQRKDAAVEARQAICALGGVSTEIIPEH